MSCKHWGEIVVVADTDSGIAALEREQITKPRPMDLEGAALHQPCSADYPSTVRLPNECSAVDSTTLHTILLQQYLKKMKVLVQGAHHQVENQKSGEGDTSPSLPPAPPLPEFPGKEPTRKPSNSLNFVTKNYDSKFVQGIGKPPPELQENTARQILRMSVAVICAHAGFEISTESVLETFVDVVHEYYLRLTKSLRVATDRQLLTGSSPFPDVIEQVMHEIGVGSVTNLHNFYQQRVVQHHAHVLRQCTSLQEDYELLRNPKNKDASRAGENALLEHTRNKERNIQFPVSEDADDLVDCHEAIPNLDDLQGMEAPTIVMHDDDALKSDAKEPTPNLDLDEDGLHVVAESPLVGTSDYNLDAISPPVPVFQRPAKRSRRQ